MFHGDPLTSPVKVNMPNNEKAYVLVLEYVEGFTLYQLANAFSEEDPEHDGDSDSWERHLMLYKKLVSEVCQDH